MTSQGGVPLPAATTTDGPTAPSLTPEKRQALFDAGIWYLLGLWPALHVACANSWGGPDSADKRDWFAGAVSELFDARPATDPGDLEYFLLQVMQDEFETDVDDDSEEELARQIVLLRKRLFEEGDVAAFRELEARWKNRGLMKTEIKVVEEMQDVDGDGEGEEWVDGDGDVEMGTSPGDVPNLVPATIRERPEPEIDDDGFTKVVGKKKR